MPIYTSLLKNTHFNRGWQLHSLMCLQSHILHILYLKYFYLFLAKTTFDPNKIHFLICGLPWENSCLFVIIRFRARFFLKTATFKLEQITRKDVSLNIQFILNKVAVNICTITGNCVHAIIFLQ